MDDNIANRFETMEKNFSGVVKGLKNDVEYMKSDLAESNETVACPSTSRTLFSGLQVSTHGKQVAPYSVRFLLASQEGGRRAYSTPGPARGFKGLSIIENHRGICCIHRKT